MSCKPKPFGANHPVRVAVPARYRAWLQLMVSPHGYFRFPCPPRAAYSHSASVGSRPPDHSQNAFASSQFTLVTGWLHELPCPPAPFRW